MIERIRERIAFYECYEKIRTTDIIDDLKAIIIKLNSENKPTEEKELQSFLKSKGVKGAHLFKGEGLLKKCNELGYNA